LRKEKIRSRSSKFSKYIAAQKLSRVEQIIAALSLKINQESVATLNCHIS
jgi:hypothetical protein